MSISKEAQALVNRYLDQFKAEYNRIGPDAVYQWTEGLTDELWLEDKSEDENAWERAHAIAEEAVEEMNGYIDTRPYYDEPFMDERNPVANWAPAGWR